MIEEEIAFRLGNRSTLEREKHFLLKDFVPRHLYDQCLILFMTEKLHLRFRRVYKAF